MRKWNNWIQQPSIGDGRMDFHSISQGLYSVMGNQNPNTTDLSWRVPGTKINRFPHLRDYRGYMLCSPHLNTDRLF
ncbi:hypothetical protein AB205_0041330 [Aquarana catesbeiana]|uniref:Uncharacterized protein n=1 Tax=Aquarana catesbeiana TaxID=8400 RepID=A0A2G9SJK2_AQUCT|nr:hypothetical protein AB205_0041330 [Aquarana catesbeiana]